MSYNSVDYELRIYKKDGTSYYSVNDLYNIQSINLLNPITNDASKIVYEIVKCSGTIEIDDSSNTLGELISSGEIDLSNTKCALYINKTLSKYCIITDASYDIDTNEVSITISDDFSYFENSIENLEYKIYENCNGTAVLATFLEVLKNHTLGYLGSLPSSESSVNTMSINTFLQYITLKNVCLNFKTVEEFAESFVKLFEFSIFMSYSGDYPVITPVRPIIAPQQTKDITSGGVVLQTKPKNITNDLIYEDSGIQKIVSNKINRVQIPVCTTSQDSSGNITYSYTIKNYYNEILDDYNTLILDENQLLTETSIIKDPYNTSFTEPLSDYIADSILDDYKDGIRVRDITICFQDGYKIGDFVTVYDTDNTYYRITGRNDLFDGEPKIKLNLQQCKLTNRIISYATLQTGNIFASKIKSLKSNVSNIIFDYYDNVDISGYTNSISVSDDDKIYAYLKNDVVYVLSRKKIYSNSDSSSMFSKFSNLTSLTFNNFDTSLVTNMSNMFSESSSISSIDISSFNTSKVTNMSTMFQLCTSLTSLNLSNFNTAKVINMEGMFNTCNNLSSITLTSFDTSNVTNMSYMFYYCHKLTNIDLSSFNISKAYNIISMFDDCYNLKTIYASSKWGSVLTYALSENMFSACQSIVGGNGTTYDSNYVDATYARIDTTSQKGYLTLKT